MKKAILFVTLGLIINANIWAQNDNYRCLGDQKKDVPTFLLNGNILIGDLLYLYDSTAVKKIKSLNVLKENDTPNRIQNLGKYGIIEINAPFQLDTKTIPEIRKWFNINDDKIIIAVDGFILDNESLLIATEAISEIKVIKNKNKVIGLNIWTLLPENRNGVTTYKDDGKIHIR
jgi:hypothetical protein